MNHLLKRRQSQIKARTKEKLYVLHAASFANRWFISAVMV